jgi:putative DNA methylase
MVKAPKKLIEVALPLDDINEAAAHEKTVRQGHPASLHLYWARRPLAAARAVLFAQLVNDPGGNRGWASGKPKTAVEQERERLFSIIRELCKWENINNPELLKIAHDEIVKSWEETKELNRGKDLELFSVFPKVQDPFSGGGAIPLEAQRLGLSAVATDLNPVALMINKAMIELPSNFINHPPVAVDPHRQRSLTTGSSGINGLCHDLSSYGELVKEIAYKKIGHFYPEVEQTGSNECSKVISWIWARTIESPNPAAKGQHVPLVKSFALSKKKGACVWVEYKVHDNMSYEFTVKKGSHLPEDLGGTVGRKGAQCILTDSPIPLSYIRQKGKEGKIKYRLMAIAAEGKRSRIYFPPLPRHEELADSIHLGDYPSMPIEHWAGCTNCVVYGYENFEDLYTKRQLKALMVFSDAILEIKEVVRNDFLERSIYPGAQIKNKADEYVKLVTTYLTFALDKMADLGNAFCRWEPIAQCPRQLYGKQAIPMVWDFAEANPFSNSSGSWSTLVSGIVKSLPKIGAPVSPSLKPSLVQQGDAQDLSSIIPRSVISTDPPYYDNVPYSNLSDLFYMWMRRTLREDFPDFFNTIHVPKYPELVANQFRHGGKAEAEKFFLDGMTHAMQNMAAQAHPAFPVTIYYAFKASQTRGANTSSSGWETFLESVITAGFKISGTWPLNTENASRMRGQNSNALASSIVLVCRKRDESAPSIPRRQFLRELKLELPEALESMIGGKKGSSPIAPVDMAQAAIGPGMEVFSRYSGIIEADGSKMSVHDALIQINKVIDEFFNEAEGDMDSDTRFCIDWFMQYGFKQAEYGQADVLARAKGTTVEGLAVAGVVKTGGGKVRLLKFEEYPENWDPEKDTRTPTWEALHQLIRALRSGGEAEAGLLLKKMAERTESIRQLAYRLYTLCERKGWAEEARAYNELIASWHGTIEAAEQSKAKSRQAKQLTLDM